MAVIDAIKTPTRTTVVRWAWATLAANTVIILTGGLVRLTASGLGCPEWPRCTEDSFTPTAEMGIHGAIEFGNRLLTYVLIAVAVGTWFAVRRWSGSTPRLRLVATILALGIPLQAVIGGITVWTDLNPWIVSVHLLVSLGLVSLAVFLLVRVRDDEVTAVPRPVYGLTVAMFACAWVVVYLGTVVTGAGPHAGDENVPRNGFDPAQWSHFHADSVYLFTGLAIGVFVAVRSVSATAARPALVLLVVIVAQAVLGFTQYLTGLPVWLVAAHLIGAAAVMGVSAWTLVTVRPRSTTLVTS